MIHNFLLAHCTVGVMGIAVDPCFRTYLLWTRIERNNACCGSFLYLHLLPPGLLVIRRVIRLQIVNHCKSV